MQSIGDREELTQNFPCLPSPIPGIGSGGRSNPSVMRMRRDVPRQYHELTDHPTLSVARNRAEHSVGTGLIEAIGRRFRRSRERVKMHPVAVAIGRLHDERVLRRPFVHELDSRRHARLDFEPHRLEAERIQRFDAKCRTGRHVDDARGSLGMRVLAVAMSRRGGVIGKSSFHPRSGTDASCITAFRTGGVRYR